VDLKKFIYAPFKRTSTEDTYLLSYTKVPNMSKDDRAAHLNNFSTVKEHGSFKFLQNILTNDTIYNVFKYADAPDKEGNVVKNNRAQKNIISDTSLLSIDVDKSHVPLNIVHDYLSEYKHIISTTSDRENKFKFRILLPVNVAIDGSNPKLYAYVVKRVSEDLLIKPDPTCFNSAQPMYSYADSEIFYTEKGELYDITELIADFTTNADTKVADIVKPKTKDAQRKLANQAIGNIHKIFSYAFEAKHGQGSLMLARAALHMRDLCFTKNEFIESISYINSVWAAPMPTERLERTIIDQYIKDFE
jgi:hypothetical protein